MTQYWDFCFDYVPICLYLGMTDFLNIYLIIALRKKIDQKYWFWCVIPTTINGPPIIFKAGINHDCLYLCLFQQFLLSHQLKRLMLYFIKRDECVLLKIDTEKQTIKIDGTVRRRGQCEFSSLLESDCLEMFLLQGGDQIAHAITQTICYGHYRLKLARNKFHCQQLKTSHWDWPNRIAWERFLRNEISLIKIPRVPYMVGSLDKRIA